MQHLGITIRVKETRCGKDKVMVQWIHEGCNCQLLISKDTLKARGVDPLYFDHRELTQEHVKGIFNGGSGGGELRRFVTKAKSSRMSRDEVVQMVYDAYDKNVTYHSPSVYVPAIPGIALLDSPPPGTYLITTAQKHWKT